MLLEILSSRGRLFAPICTLFVLLVFVGCGEEKPLVGAITGTVKSGEKIVGDCKIAVYETTSMYSMSAKVDDSGAFSIKNLPFGDYQVKLFPTPLLSGEVNKDPRFPKKFRHFETSGITFTVDDPGTKDIVVDMQ